MTESPVAGFGAMRSRLAAVLVVLSVASLFLGLYFGSLHFSLTQTAGALLSDTPDLAHRVIWELRLPRVLAAFVCGALLATAGALLQVLLRNPLADPYILGVSGGAALGALAAMVFGAGALGVNGIALLGALVAAGVVFGVGFRGGDWNAYRLLLTGVVLAAGLGALISLVLTLAPDAQLKGMLFWLMGDLSDAGGSGAAWIVLAIVLGGAMLLAPGLNALNLGSLKARSLGVAVGALQIAIYFGASAATVAAVLLGGTIGFIGLIMPHVIRLLGITDYRWLLPLSALLGGAVLTLADTLARTVWAPQQLPVGIFTALIGVPTMLWLLSARR
ncbi:MAG TPA: iron ABC transporter permease [Burkholderiales bacterium]|nr:iron ABC transporter permease [Burkholderiales bacterium]